MTPSDQREPTGLAAPGDEQKPGDLERDFSFSWLAREINDRIEAHSPLIVAGAKMCLVCECGSGDCKAQIQMTQAQYQSVRQNLRTFAVAQGHESPNAERILNRNNSWVLVEKLHQARVMGVLLLDVQPTLGNTSARWFKGA